MTGRVPRAFVLAERELPALARIVDAPLDGRGLEEIVAIALGLRGWSLYRGLTHSLSGPSIETAHVDLRALLDATILARWIERDPPLRLQLWFAEDQRERLVGRGFLQEFLRRRGRPQPPEPPDWDRDAIETEIREAREAAAAAGIRLGTRSRRCMPQIEQMVQDVGDDLWEVYHVAYRLLSPVQHSGGRSFVGDDVEQRDGSHHLRTRPPLTAPALRGLAIAGVLMLWATVSRQSRLGIERRCDELRAAVVLAAPVASQLEKSP